MVDSGPMPPIMPMVFIHVGRCEQRWARFDFSVAPITRDHQITRSSSFPDHFHICPGNGHLNDAILIVNPQNPLRRVGVAALVIEPGEGLRAGHIQLHAVEFALNAFHSHFSGAQKLQSCVAGNMLARIKNYKFAGTAFQSIILAAAAVGQIPPQQDFTLGEKVVIKNMVESGSMCGTSSFFWSAGVMCSTSISSLGSTDASSFCGVMARQL